MQPKQIAASIVLTVLLSIQIKGPIKTMSVNLAPGPHKAGVRTELLNTVEAKKLAYYDHTMRKQGSCLEEEIMQLARNNGR